MDKFIKGNCNEMCPQSEMKMRIREHLVHFYELNDKRINVPDERKMVKEFSRSAAGIRLPKPSDLRTIDGLRSTINYLIENILCDNRRPFYFAFDFIFDRLRSVRQEMVIQNLENSIKILLLQPIVLFLGYSIYRLCNEEIDKFDVKIGHQHFQECLKILLCCYDEYDYEMNRKHSNETSGIDQHSVIINYREIFESIYIVFNLGSVDAIKRGLFQRDPVKKPILELALKISKAYFHQHYYIVLKYIRKLPHILCAIASLKLQEIRREILLRFSIAYHSPTTSVSIQWLCKLLLYENVNRLIEDCKYYNIEVINDKQMIRFNKNLFDKNKSAIKPHHIHFVEEKLQNTSIKNLILLRSF